MRLHVLIIGIFEDGVRLARRLRAAQIWEAISAVRSRAAINVEAPGRAIISANRAARPRHHRRRDRGMRSIEMVWPSLDKKPSHAARRAANSPTASSLEDRPEPHLSGRIRPSSRSGRGGDGRMALVTAARAIPTGRPCRPDEVPTSA